VVPLAGGDRLGDGGVVEVEAVAGHEQVEAGRVPSPDLEPVEGGQGDLDGRAGTDGGVPRSGTGEVGDRPCVAQSVAADRPGAVAEAEERGVRRLQGGAGERRPGSVDRRHQVGDGPLDPRDHPVDLGRQVRLVDEPLDAGHPVEQLVDRRHEVGHPAEAVPALEDVRCDERLGRGPQRLEERAASAGSAGGDERRRR
jgi:hypothetical protein